MATYGESWRPEDSWDQCQFSTLTENFIIKIDTGCFLWFQWVQTIEEATSGHWLGIGLDSIHWTTCFMSGSAFWTPLISSTDYVGSKELTAAAMAAIVVLLSQSFCNWFHRFICRHTTLGHCLSDSESTLVCCYPGWWIAWYWKSNFERNFIMKPPEGIVIHSKSEWFHTG